MSALRHLLGALWAAVWLRWRLLRLKLRRLFGRRRLAIQAPDFHLTAAETPTEGVDYDPAELPPELLARLDATRAGLLDSARRTSSGTPARPARARRGRAIAITIAALLGLGIVGTGASALVSGSTGIPAVDRLLGIYERESSRPEASGTFGPGAQDLRPAPGGNSVSMETSLDDGSRVQTTFYISLDGSGCTAVVGPDAEQVAARVHCTPSEVLETRLTRDRGLVIAAQQYGATVLLTGVVDDGVIGLEGVRQPLNISLGERWPMTDARVLKPFVAVGPTDPGATMVVSDFALRAVVADGSRTDIVP